MQTSQPVVSLAMLEAFVGAVCFAIVAFHPFGWTITDDQRNAILGLITTGYVIVVAVTLGVKPMVEAATRRYVKATWAVAHGGVVEGRGAAAPAVPSMATLNAYVDTHRAELDATPTAA
jgi:hypothetical protein